MKQIFNVCQFNIFILWSLLVTRVFAVQFLALPYPPLRWFSSGFHLASLQISNHLLWSLLFDLQVSVVLSQILVFLSKSSSFTLYTLFLWIVLVEIPHNYFVDLLCPSNFVFFSQMFLVSLSSDSSLENPSKFVNSLLFPNNSFPFFLFKQHSIIIGQTLYPRRRNVSHGNFRTGWPGHHRTSCRQLRPPQIWYITFWYSFHHSFLWGCV